MKRLVAGLSCLIILCTGPTNILHAQDISSPVANVHSITPPENISEVGEFIVLKRVDGAAILKWSVQAAKDNIIFYVEHAVNGKDFTTVGQVAGQGNAHNNLEYDFLDKEVNKGLNYYRLRMVTSAGKQSYSEIRELMIGHKMQELNIYSNPTMSKAILTLDAEDAEPVQVVIFDLSGNEVQRNNLVVKGKKIELNVQNLDRGMYSVLVIKERGEQLKGKLIVTY